MIIYRVRFVGEGGPIEVDDAKNRPVHCGHRHTSLEAARKCLKLQRDTTCKTYKIGAGLQYRLASRELWHWMDKE